MGGGGVKLVPKGCINSAGLGVIWNLITQTALYPSPFVVAPSSITMTSQVFNINQVDTPFTPSRYVCGFNTG
jgi:hypothetical protein